MAKDYDKSIADYSEAIRLCPQNAAYYCERSRVWCVKQEYDKALADCNEAIRLAPEFAAAYYNRGKALQGKGVIAKAIVELQ